MGKKNTILSNAQDAISKYDITPGDFNEAELLKLMWRAEELDDSRHRSYVRHRIGDIVVIAFLAILSGSNEWEQIGTFAKKKEVWLKRFLVLDNGIPSTDCIQRVMSMLDTSLLFRLYMEFLLEKVRAYAELTRHDNPLKTPEKDIISIDGKTTKGSAGQDTGNGKTKALHTLNAYSHSIGVCIGQQFIPEKTNEITATKDILEILDVKDTIVTWDALNTQKENVAQVIAQKGDYVVALKANHARLSDEVKDYFDDEGLLKDNPEVSRYEYTEKEHNAVITREYILSTEIGWIYDNKAWKGLAAIGCVKKTIKPLKGEESLETRYYLCSIKDVKLFAKSARCHWGVENSLHFQLDFTFKDDKNKTRDKKSVQNLQIMKKIALALLKLVQPMYKKSMQLIRYDIALDFENEMEKIFTVLNVETVEKQLRETGKVK